jgi:hypothetical protein
VAQTASFAFSSHGRLTQNSARRDGLRNNPDYRQFIENLRNTGYFKEEMEGSKLWIELEDKAAAAFVEVRHTE